MRPENPDAASALDEPLLSAAELRGRAKVGVAVIASRSVVVRGLTLAGYVALARLLAPSDFGLIAFGLTLVTLVTFVADGGIGAGLVRRREPPEPADLQAMSALQLLISLPIAAITALAAIPMGSAALVTAVMVSSLPVIALRTPGYITLSRRLAYKQLAVVEITETIVYVAWSVGGAALGAGVWAMATGAVARAVAGALVMARVAPHGMLLPRWSTNRVRPMLAFGARFQAGQLTLFARDHGINVATFAIAGLSTLGLWSVIGRLMQVPFMLFEAVGTVAFPTLSRLGDTGEDLRPTLERGLRLMALATALVLVPLMASAPALVPSVFGAVWASGASIIPIASLGLLVSGPLSVVAIGYLLAAGDAATPLRAGVVNAIAYFGVALPLLPSMGVQALALGWATASLTEAVVLGRATNRRSGARVVAALAAPAALAAVIGVSGYLITDDLPPTLLTAAASAAASLGAFVIAMLVLARSDLMSLAHLMASLRSKPKPATASGV
ncbi:MAG: oligosaccharide flippase family protein [Chloroflexota bacterium]|nr:oligosaccharide flippase family protein [Chloroflexota bacterium]